MRHPNTAVHFSNVKGLIFWWILGKKGTKSRITVC